METNKGKPLCYLIRQNKTIYKFSIKCYSSSTGQEKSKLQENKELFILIETAASVCQVRSGQSV